MAIGLTAEFDNMKVIPDLEKSCFTGVCVEGGGVEMLISLGSGENRIGIMEYKLLFLGVLL